MVAELVHTFLLPEVKKQTLRDKGIVACVLVTTIPSSSLPTSQTSTKETFAGSS